MTFRQAEQKIVDSSQDKYTFSPTFTTNEPRKVADLLNTYTSFIEITKEHKIRFYFADTKDLFFTFNKLGIHDKKHEEEITRKHTAEPGETQLLITFTQEMFDDFWGKNSVKTILEIAELYRLDRYDACYEKLTQAPDHLIQQIVRLCIPEKDLTLLHFLITGISPDKFARLLKLMTDPTLNQIFMIPNQHNHSTGLQLIFFFQSYEVCLQLINRISSETLNRILDSRDKLDSSPLITAADAQSEDIFIAIVKNSSANTLAKAACMRTPDTGISAYEVAAQNLSPQAFKLFLQKISDPAVSDIVNDYFSEFPYHFHDSFFIIASHQPIENCELFLSILRDENRLALMNFCKLNTHFYSVRFALRALQHHKLARESKDEVFDESCKFSNQFLTILQEYDRAHPPKKQKPFLSTEVEKKALEAFKSGAFVKVIRADKKENNREFLDHLHTPENRHEIRCKESQDKQGFKIVLDPQKEEKKKEEKEGKKDIIVYDGGPDKLFPIIVARTTEQRILHKQQKEKYENSTKHPVSYVSPHLFASLFGFTQDREMVGYAFHVHPEKAKFLATRDIGTFQRWWYNKDLNQLYHWTNRARFFICKSFDEFTRRINQIPYTVNEALVKLNKNDLFAIIIAKDTPLARRIALERRRELIRLYDKELPILFYDPDHQQSEVYTSAEQKVDHTCFMLEDLKNALEQQVESCYCCFSWFRKYPKLIIFHFDDYEYAISHSTAKGIIKVLETQTDSPDACFAAIKVILYEQPPPSPNPFLL